jgi:hypothetical protein
MSRSLPVACAIGGHSPSAPMEEAGWRSSGSPKILGPDRRGSYSEYLALRSEVRDLEEALEARRRATHRHFLWAVLGLSPAAFLPMIGLLRGGSLVLVLVLGTLVTVVELIRGMKARGDFFRMLERYKRGSARLKELGNF